MAFEFKMTFKEFLSLNPKTDFKPKVQHPHVVQSRKPQGIKPASPIAFDKKQKWKTNFGNRFIIRGTKNSGLVI